MAFAVLFAWPLVVVLLFKRLPLQLAMICAIMGGYLLLPSETAIAIDLPLLPQIDKNLVPALTAMICAILIARQADQTSRTRRAQPAAHPPSLVLPGWLPRSKIGLLLSIGVVVSTALTVLTNGDRIVMPGLVLPAQRPYDVFSQLLYWGVIFLPMLLGRKYLADDKGHRLLMIVLCVAAFFYSFLSLYEVRMSPRINSTLYGFFPHDWLQHRRAGGWRPIVFLNHGLLLGIFLACAAVACAVMIRVSKTSAHKALFGVLLLWLLMALYLGKTLGALSLALMLVPLAILAPVRIQLLIAAIFAGVVMLYPMLRGAGLIPVDDIVQFFASIDAGRANSLQFRIDNEDILLAHANERPLFGWAGWGRWRVFDPETGQDLAVSDGFWVITIGENGWFGYIARFGLFCLPMMLFFFRRKKLAISPVTAGLCLVAAANLADLLPNAGSSPVFFLILGALLGRLEIQGEALDSASDADAETVQSPRDRLRPVTARDHNRPQPVLAVTTEDPRPSGNRYSRFAPTKQRER